MPELTTYYDGTEDGQKKERHASPDQSPTNDAEGSSIFVLRKNLVGYGERLLKPTPFAIFSVSVTIPTFFRDVPA